MQAALELAVSCLPPNRMESLHRLKPGIFYRFQIPLSMEAILGDLRSFALAIQSGVTAMALGLLKLASAFGIHVARR
jgi:hypothetical protein